MAKPRQRYSDSEHSLRHPPDQSLRNFPGAFVELGGSNVEDFLRGLPCAKIKAPNGRQVIKPLIYPEQFEQRLSFCPPNTFAGAPAGDPRPNLPPPFVVSVSNHERARTDSANSA